MRLATAVGLLLIVCLRQTRAQDCNLNGIPDPTDIANGLADCGGNGIPDVCESQFVVDHTLPAGVNAQDRPLSIVAADFNADSRTDIAFVVPTASEVFIGTNNGAGG